MALPGNAKGLRWWLLGLVALGLALRLGWVVWSGWAVGDFGDSQDYLTAAATLCSDEPYPEHGDLPFFRAPGLPLVIAVVTGCHPGNIVLLKVTLTVIDSLLIVVVAALALALWQSPRAALVAATLTAVYPPFILWSGEIRTEPVFMLLLSLGILLTLRGIQSAELSRWHLAAAGIAFSLAALTRPSALIAAPFFAMVVLLWDPSRTTLRARALSSAVLAFAAGATLVPWAAHNVLRYDELILVNDAGGYNLWRGTHPAMHQILQASTPAEYEARVAAFHTEVQHPVEARVRRIAGSPSERSRAWRELAIQRWLEQPLETAQIVASSLARYWRPWLMPLEHSGAKVAASAMVIVPLYVLAGVGWWRLVRLRSTLAAVLAAWLVAAWLAHAPFQVVMRFRIPYTDPILLALAAGTLLWIGRSAAARWRELNALRSDSAV
jgi:4-amino-4-deoxy-L-arabinose transferase-like glycosyltransferase